MKEVDNILRILKEARKFIQEENTNELKILSDQTIHTATISQDPDNIIVAVLVYSLGKVMERSHYRDMEGWDQFYSTAIKNLDHAIINLEKNDVDSARNHLGNIRNCLNKLSGNLKEYIKDVFRKAEINKAFRLYEHGLSSKQTAELLGVSLWDLSTYIGQSSINNSNISISLPVSKRIKIAEDVFR